MADGEEVWERRDLAKVKDFRPRSTSLEVAGSERDADTPPPLVPISDAGPPVLEPFPSSSPLMRDTPPPPSQVIANPATAHLKSRLSDRRLSFDPAMLPSRRPDRKNYTVIESPPSSPGSPKPRKLSASNESPENLEDTAKFSTISSPSLMQVQADSPLHLRERAQSFDMLAEQPIKGKSKAAPFDASKSMSMLMISKNGQKSGKVISGPTGLKHTDLRAALSAHSIPHRFNAYSFTPLRSPKCSLCGQSFKGLRCKAYKCQECQYLCHPRCLPNVPADCGLKPDLVNIKQSGGSSKSSKVFGVELAEQVKAEGGQVPSVILACIAAVEKKGLDMEGIYRVSGGSSQTTKLREAFSQGKANLDDPEWFDIASVTSIIKQYFRELPTPLIAHDVYSQLIAAIKLEGDDEKIAGIKKSLLNLPPSHSATLEYVARHLVKIDKNSAVNKMTSYNLSLLFGPTLMKAQNAIADLEDMQVQAKVIEYLIVHCDSIFESSS